MIEISKIKIQGLENSYNRLLEAVSANNQKDFYVEFFDFLNNLFPLREGIGEKDVEKETRLKKDSIFGALKYFYEIYKHTENNKANKLIESSIFVCSKKYPYSYPYTYGNAFVQYKKLPQDLIDTQDKENHRTRFKELYEKYLNEKYLLEIVKTAKEETMRIMEEK